MTNNNTDFQARDYKWMSLAIKCAHNARFISKPNPNVGCVIVKGDQLLATGHTQAPGSAHAEINALDKINHQAQGATCYVTLEPCAHTGKTGPCAHALVKSGVTKVVIACLDPNPLVAGKGIKILETAGIQVVSGLLKSDVNQQLSGFLTRMTHKKPQVTLKLACSLDGNIALKDGESKWITSPDSRKDVQIHRALSGAILTTSQTVIADNPSMTVRQQDWPLEAAFGTQPLKAVLDKSLRTPTSAKIYQDNAIVFYNRAYTSESRIQAFSSANIQLIEISTLNGQLNIKEALTELAKLEINDVWVECGAKLAGHLLQSQLINTFIMYQAPLLLGASSINSMGFLIDSMEHAIALHRTDVRQIGPDTKMTYILK